MLFVKNNEKLIKKAFKIKAVWKPIFRKVIMRV